MKKIFIGLFLVGFVRSFPDGAPCSALYSLAPNELSHHAVSQQGNFPYQFQIFQEGDLSETPVVNYRPCTLYKIRLLDRKGGSGFRGFIIQPRLLSADGGIDEVHRLGSFQRSNDWNDKGIRSLSCSGSDEYDTITHANREKKKVVEVEWMPMRNDGPVQFLVTVVESLTKFWANQVPTEGRLDPEKNAPEFPNGCDASAVIKDSQLQLKGETIQLTTEEWYPFDPDMAPNPFEPESVPQTTKANKPGNTTESMYKGKNSTIFIDGAGASMASELENVDLVHSLNGSMLGLEWVDLGNQTKTEKKPHSNVSLALEGRQELETKDMKLPIAEPIPDQSQKIPESKNLESKIPEPSTKNSPSVWNSTGTTGPQPPNGQSSTPASPTPDLNPTRLRSNQTTAATKKILLTTPSNSANSKISTTTPENFADPLDEFLPVLNIPGVDEKEGETEEVGVTEIGPEGVESDDMESELDEEMESSSTTQKSITNSRTRDQTPIPSTTSKRSRGDGEIVPESTTTTKRSRGGLELIPESLTTTKRSRIGVDAEVESSTTTKRSRGGLEIIPESTTTTKRSRGGEEISPESSTTTKRSRGDGEIVPDEETTDPDVLFVPSDRSTLKPDDPADLEPIQPQSPKQTTKKVSIASTTLGVSSAKSTTSNEEDDAKNGCVPDTEFWCRNWINYCHLHVVQTRCAKTCCGKESG